MPLRLLFYEHDPCCCCNIRRRMADRHCGSSPIQTKAGMGKQDGHADGPVFPFGTVKSEEGTSKIGNARKRIADFTAERRTCNPTTVILTTAFV